MGAALKISLAQIDCRLGDIDEICERIRIQADLAHAAGSSLLCLPTPLVTGVLPGDLPDSHDFQASVIDAFTKLASDLRLLHIRVLIPAFMSVNGMAFIEVFSLFDGRVVPFRTVGLLSDASSRLRPWAPPCIDVDGVRVTIVFDLERDMQLLPPGCDLVIYYQSLPFDSADETSCGIAAVPDGHFTSSAREKGVWLACMVPLGGFEAAVFTGGSFVLDDSGRVVSFLPPFEEGLLTEEIMKGSAERVHPPVAELPVFDRWQWLWEALRLHLADTVRSSSRTGAIVGLTGDLVSGLLAMLAVDALGARNVTALIMGYEDATTPQEEMIERERLARARSIAAALSVSVVDVPLRFSFEPDGAADRGYAGRAGLRRDGDMLYLAEAARSLGLVPLVGLTKTAVALAPDACSIAPVDAIAPFSDVYLTALEFVARTRNRISGVMPADLMGLSAIERAMREIVSEAIGLQTGDTELIGRMHGVLDGLEPSQIDDALEAHVDREIPLHDIPLAKTDPEACAVLFMMVRRGEFARRKLPSGPVVSSRSFFERAWPAMLSWSPTLTESEGLTLEDLAKREGERLEERSEERGRQTRGEIMGLIGGLLGLDPGQIEELRSQMDGSEEDSSEEEDASGDVGSGLMKGSIGRIRSERSPGDMPGMGRNGVTFFSLN